MAEVPLSHCLSRDPKHDLRKEFEKWVKENSDNDMIQIKMFNIADSQVVLYISFLRASPHPLRTFNGAHDLSLTYGDSYPKTTVFLTQLPQHHLITRRIASSRGVSIVLCRYFFDLDSEGINLLIIQGVG